MILENVRLPYGGKDNASLTIYSSEMREKPAVRKRPTVLIAPGGGYGSLSDRESEVVALRFLSWGYNAAVLKYSVAKDAVFPQPLCEAALAMAYLKENAEQFFIDKTRIYTCGFSAGAHLLLSLGVYWDKAWLAEKVGKENELLRPTAQIICYPVVTADPEFSHEGSYKKLLGDDFSEERKNLLSLEKQVSKNTPPTFLWTTQTDATVPCENSLLLAAALQKAGVAMEFHLYGWGRHGLSVSDITTQTQKNLSADFLNSHVQPHAASWLPLCKEWLDIKFGIQTEE